MYWSKFTELCQNYPQNEKERESIIYDMQERGMKMLPFGDVQPLSPPVNLTPMTCVYE